MHKVRVRTGERVGLQITLKGDVGRGEGRCGLGLRELDRHGMAPWIGLREAGLLPLSFKTGEVLVAEASPSDWPRDPGDLANKLAPVLAAFGCPLSLPNCPPDVVFGLAMTGDLPLPFGELGLCTTGLLIPHQPSSLLFPPSWVLNSTHTPGSSPSSSSCTIFLPTFSLSVLLSLLRIQRLIRSPLGRVLTTAPQTSPSPSTPSNSCPMSANTNQSHVRSTSAGCFCLKVMVHFPPLVLLGSSHIGLIGDLNR